MYVCMSTCYSAPSRFLLGGAPDYSADTESEFHARAHEQLRVKDLPRVLTRRLEVVSNPQPSGCKAPNIPLHHRATHTYNDTLTQELWYAQVYPDTHHVDHDDYNHENE